jgi:hypothetical protein
MYIVEFVKNGIGSGVLENVDITPKEEELNNLNDIVEDLVDEPQQCSKENDSGKTCDTCHGTGLEFGTEIHVYTQDVTTCERQCTGPCRGDVEYRQSE